MNDILRAIVCGAIVVAIGFCVGQLDLRRRVNRLMLAVMAVGMLFALLVELVVEEAGEDVGGEGDEGEEGEADTEERRREAAFGFTSRQWGIRVA